MGLFMGSVPRVANHFVLLPDTVTTHTNTSRLVKNNIPTKIIAVVIAAGRAKVTRNVVVPIPIAATLDTAGTQTTMSTHVYKTLRIPALRATDVDLLMGLFLGAVL